MTENTIAVILAGGVPTKDQFSVLTMNRSKASLPFGGVYRLIDFSLSCLMESNIEKVGIITQFLPSSLIDHVGDGYSWDMKGFQRCAKILPPYISYEEDTHWYRGTGNALLQNINFIKDQHPDYVFITPGEHIYNVNFSAIMKQHIERKSKITLVYKKIPKSRYCPRFGYVKIQGDHITNFIEKPQKPESEYVSLGIYLFNREILLENLLTRGKGKEFYNLVSDIIVPLSRKKQIHGYEYTDYWAYLYDFYDYFHFHMELLKGRLPLRNWNVVTNLEDRDTGFRPPAEVLSQGRVNNSLVAPGCYIEGEVHNSILFPGVRIGKKSSVNNCVIMHDTIIKENSHLYNVICDKDVSIGTNSTLGTPVKGTVRKKDLILLGKGTAINGSEKVEAGTHINPSIIL